MSDATRMRKILFQIINNQIGANSPAETKQTLERLQAEGHSKEKAMGLIACVVSTEIFEVMEQGQLFDEGRFVRALYRLPVLPD